MKRQKLFGALDLGGSFLKFAYGNTEKGIIYHDRIQIKEPDNNDFIFDAIKQAVNIINKHEQSVKTFGMGTPGTVDVDRGMITGITPNLPNIQNIAFKKEIEKNNNIKVYLENDANLMSYAEASLYPSQSVLGITIGTGIGSGFIYQNDIFRGQNYSAIELGHTIVNLGGRRCKCGKFGCVEAYSSANSMLAICREEFPNLEINNIAHLLKIGKENKEIKSKINLLNSYLAMTIANAVSTLDPQVVCIGGGVVEIKDFDFDFLKQKIKGFLASNYQCVKIVKAQFENRAGIYGGILIAESKYLEHNLLYK